MEYEIKYEGTTCTLPSFTRGVKRNIDKVSQQIQNTEIDLDTRIEALYGFVKECTGAKQLEKMLGTTDMDEMDLNEINILYLKIVSAYDEPIKEYNKPVLDKETRKVFEEIEKVVRNMDSINQITKKKKR